MTKPDDYKISKIFMTKPDDYLQKILTGEEQEMKMKDYIYNMCIEKRYL
jgi:hypothetical protein